MAEYSITMKQKNAEGTYDTLYPATIGSQVSGNIQSSQIEGSIPSSQIDGTFPASQITGLPTSLPADGGNADTVGGQTVQQIIQSALSQGTQIETGSYVGTGATTSMTLTFSFSPKIVFIFCATSVPNNADGYCFGCLSNSKFIGFISQSSGAYGIGVVYGTATINNTTITWNAKETTSLVPGSINISSLVSYQGKIAQNIANFNRMNYTYNYIAIG